MSAALPTLVTSIEHLTPHDLVTYSRCPYEMELKHRLHSAQVGGGPLPSALLANGPPLHRSPLFAPPENAVRVFEGRLDLAETDVLVYEDEGERDLPILFPADRIHPEPAFRRHGPNLVDDELRFSGRPDYILRRAGGVLVPVEYKATHLFVGWRSAHLESHARGFDLLQAIAECRLVHMASGSRPPYGIVLYGDRGADGAHEGWVEVPYRESEERWLRSALAQIRSDRERSPVPSERNCPTCEPNRDGHCRYAAARFEGAHPFS